MSVLHGDANQEIDIQTAILRVMKFCSSLWASKERPNSKNHLSFRTNPFPSMAKISKPPVGVRAAVNLAWNVCAMDKKAAAGNKGTHQAFAHQLRLRVCHRLAIYPTAAAVEKYNAAGKVSERSWPGETINGGFHLPDHIPRCTFPGQRTVREIWPPLILSVAGLNPILPYISRE